MKWERNAGKMHNVHSQRAGSENAADEVLVSLVVEMSESESLSLAFQHFFLLHLAGALLRLLWSNSCVCFFVACQNVALPRYAHLEMAHPFPKAEVSHNLSVKK